MGFISPFAIVGALLVLGMLMERRRQRRLCTVGRRLDSMTWPPWTTVATRVAERHSLQGAEDIARNHFETTEQPSTVAMRQLVRLHPTADDLPAGLTATLAVRDQAIAEVAHHKIELMAL
jgi:hypothetical protein